MEIIQYRKCISTFGLFNLIFKEVICIYIGNGRYHLILLTINIWFKSEENDLSYFGKLHFIGLWAILAPMDFHQSGRHEFNPLWNSQVYMRLGRFTTTSSTVTHVMYPSFSYNSIDPKVRDGCEPDSEILVTPSARAHTPKEVPMKS